MMNKKLKEHKEEISTLKRIHQKIYFRDVSKYYILEFARKYLNNPNIDAYHSAEKILRLNFGKKKNKEFRKSYE